MNKQDFIFRLIDCFPSSFKERDKSDVFDEYDRGLSDNLDFDKLFSCFAKNYDKSTPPRPAWFKDFIGECAIEVNFCSMSAERRGALVKVATWFNSLEYQWEHKPLPQYLRQLVKEHSLTDREIDLMILSGGLE